MKSIYVAETPKMKNQSIAKNNRYIRNVFKRIVDGEPDHLETAQIEEKGAL
jgi:hypothetical protein